MKKGGLVYVQTQSAPIIYDFSSFQKLIYIMFFYFILSVKAYWPAR